jgi:hypothetical protein
MFAPLEDPVYFVGKMRVATDRLGLEWPDRVDFSADGLRFRAFPEAGEAEFGMSETTSGSGPVITHSGC